jgi:hypothetical protein
VLVLAFATISSYTYCVLNGFVDQDEWTASLWPYHVLNTAVLYRHRDTGEYKHCLSVKERTAFQLLKWEDVDASKTCGVFRVRFRGRTYMREIHSVWLDWKCRKDGREADLRITCWPLKGKIPD